jgi:hypothetical protein
MVMYLNTFLIKTRHYLTILQHNSSRRLFILLFSPSLFLHSLFHARFTSLGLYSDTIDTYIYCGFSPPQSAPHKCEEALFFCEYFFLCFFCSLFLFTFLPHFFPPSCTLLVITLLPHSIGCILN